MRVKSTYLDNEITTGLYTNGNDISYYDSYDEYVGWYHTYATGEIYSLPSYVDGKSIKLRLKIDDSKLEFTNASQNKFETYFDYKHISPYAPFPTQDDYDVGYIIRYFIRRRNDPNSPITEISEDDYKSLTDNTENFYSIITNTVSFKWKISGDKHDSYNDNGVRVYSGVYDTNKRILFDIEKEFRGITNYLTNLLQFHKL